MRLTMPLLAGLLALGVGVADAARVSNIKNTKHNLSTSGSTVSGSTVRSTSEDEICVYCHTPHGATLKDAGGNNVKSPLWNRTIPVGSSYTGYTSSSLDAAAIQTGFDGKPGGSSKLCLSCHDGTIAIGQVNVLNGKYDTSQIVPGLSAKMPDGDYGANSGFTRNLGTNLTNDHPISVTFTGSGAGATAGSGTLADRDGELRDVDSNQSYTDGGTLYIGVRSSGVKPKLPLEPTDASSTPANKGQVQCASCHDPHIREADSSAVDYQREKFLRLSRFQDIQPNATIQAKDIICRICHNKDRDGVFAYSAHANSAVATQIYSSAAATLREFPASLPVWKASCLNCHDPHTVEGSRRLLREGTDSTASPKQGGGPAIEETCYQCHDGSATVITAPGGGASASVPNIKDDFALAIHMPIKSTHQPAGSEMHDIGNLAGSACATATGGVTDSRNNSEGCGKDFIEAQSRLGLSAIDNRHAECTDCHNPHRVMKLRIFYSRQSAGNINGTDHSGTVGQVLSPASLVNPDPEGTHLHVETTGYTHTNIISGVLRGTWGVEPDYGSNRSFHVKPGGFTVKRGDPGSSTATTVAQKYVTREYQICLKCHSNYGYSDDDTYPDYPAMTSGRPVLGTSNGYIGGTPAGTNGLHVYTNQAREFQAPSTHRGEGISVGNDGGANNGSSTAPNYNTNNHRSWHPVMDITGRDTSARSISNANQWRSPFNNALGNQTMYCTDCHGSNVSSGTSVIPDGTAPNGKPWGPHGSTNNFLLKGGWSSLTGKSSSPDTRDTDICFKCHIWGTYANGKNYPNSDGCNQSSKNQRTGFSTGTSGQGDLHCYHNEKLSKPLQCTWCHIALPHGWKNKAFLVNLNDVGREAGYTGVSKEVNIGGNNNVYSQEPYYLNAKLKVTSFAQSGSWSAGNCGSSNKVAGNRINSTDGGSSNDTNTGKDWMTNTCYPPP